MKETKLYNYKLSLIRSCHFFLIPAWNIPECGIFLTRVFLCVDRIVFVFFRIKTESYTRRNTHRKKPVFWHILRGEYLNVKHIHFPHHVSTLKWQNQYSNKIKCVKHKRIMRKTCVNGFFYRTDTLPNKLKARKLFILRPGSMYCQVRS